MTDSKTTKKLKRKQDMFIGSNFDALWTIGYNKSSAKKRLKEICGDALFKREWRKSLFVRKATVTFHD